MKELGLLVYSKKIHQKKKISKITKCDTHTKIGVSSDGKYDCYLSTNSGAESNLLDELKRTEIQIIDKKERPKNGFTFILLFLKNHLIFFQPIIYHGLIEDMFIFDYNPLLIYLYSPQKEQISLSALFTIYL